MKTKIEKPTMKERWRYLCLRLGIKNGATIDEMYEVFEKNYGDPARAHHAFGHIEFMLDWLDKVEATVDNYYAMAMAIWFHDLIYDILRKDNEEKSAEEVVKFLRNAGVLEWFVRIVEALIMVTKPGRVAVTADEKIMVSLDYMIMAADEKTFDRYDQNIAREYIPAYGEDRYFEGRKQFLTGVLDKTIFPSPVFAEYEEKAKNNVRRILDTRYVGRTNWLYAIII